MIIIASFVVSVVAFSIIRFVNILLDYLERSSGSLDVRVFIDSESVSIFNAENFYTSLVDFIYKSKKQQVCHFRRDLDGQLNVRYYEKSYRTDKPNVIRNTLIKSVMGTSSKIPQKCSSYIILANLDTKQQDSICNFEVMRLKALNLKIFSQKLIMDKRIVELIGIPLETKRKRK